MSRPFPRYKTELTINQVEEIAKVPGIDVLFIGPWDLGNNIGRPAIGAFHDDLNAAIDRIYKASVNNGKRVGIYCAGGAAAKKYADQGFHMVRELEKTWWKIANYFYL